MINKEAAAATAASTTNGFGAATKQTPTPSAIITDRHEAMGHASRAPQPVAAQQAKRTSRSDWQFSPVRQEAFEAEQRALEHFASIAEAMPTVAKQKTAELIPSEDDGVIRMVRRLP